MEILDFVPPDERGKFFAGTPAAGSERFYHGTSRHFMNRIRDHGFVVRYRLVNDEQLAILNRHAGSMNNVGPNLVRSLGAAKRLSLTRSSTLALSYASGGLRGGIYKSLLDDLVILLDADAEPLPEGEKKILHALKAELEALATEPGIVCAVDLNAAELAKLDPPGQDPTYAPFDIGPDRVIAVMNVPAGYEYR